MAKNSRKPKIGEKIRTIREALDYSQTEFGEVIGTNQGMVSKMERDEEVPTPQMPAEFRAEALSRYSDPKTIGIIRPGLEMVRNFRGMQYELQANILMELITSIKSE